MSLTSPYRLFHRHRKRLFGSVAVEVKARHAGSIVGVAWIVLGPLILLGLYGLIYSVVFAIRPSTMTPADYLLNMFAGLSLYLFFGQAIQSSATSLTKNRALLLNLVFPSELIPVRETLASGSMLIGACTVVVAGSLLLGHASLAWTLLPLVLLCLVMFVIGLAWIVALANLVVRDVQQILVFVLIILLVASPIAYTPDMLPPGLELLLYLNPLGYFVVPFQTIVVHGRFPDPAILGGMVLIAVLSFHGGFRVFVVGKMLIADHAS